MDSIKSLLKWLEDNDKEFYSTYNEGKYVIAERFIRTLKHKIYKHMTAVRKHFYFDVLDGIIDKRNTYHNTINENKNSVTWTYVFNYLNGKEIVEKFYEKEL